MILATSLPFDTVVIQFQNKNVNKFLKIFDFFYCFLHFSWLNYIYERK